MYNALIACASKENIRILSQAMEGSYRVRSCSTEDEALSILQTLRPEILVVELSPLEMNGLAVLRKTQYQPPVILALVRNPTRRAIYEALFMGVQTVVYLPADPEQVLAHLARMTGQLLEAHTAPLP